MAISLLSTQTQVWILSLVYFFTGGSYYTLMGMGGGGLADSSVSSNANTALYVCAAVTGFLAGTVNNLFGPRIACFLGGVAIALYVSSLLTYTFGGPAGFVLAAGGLMGIGQALLSTVGGAIVSAYPSPAQRGRAASIFMALFCLSGILGGLIPFALHFHPSGHGHGPDGDAAGVGTGTYAAFLALVGVGIASTALLMPPGRLIRDDGQRVELRPSRGWQAELLGMGRLLRQPKTWLVTPFFMSITCYYAYQFNGFNLALFNLRSRGLNNAFYRVAGLAAAIGVGRLMDSSRWSKLRRVQGVALALLVVTGLTFGGAWAVMRSHHPPSALAQGNLRSSSSLSSEFEPIDVYSAAYWIAWPIFLGWGALDMSMNVLAYWVVANISRDANESSNYSGYLASMQYISSAIYWQFDAQHIPQIVFWLLTFMIVAVGLVAAFATGFVIDRLDKESQVFAAEVNDKQSMSSATDSFDFPTA